MKDNELREALADAKILISPTYLETTNRYDTLFRDVRDVEELAAYLKEAFLRQQRTIDGVLELLGIEETSERFEGLVQGDKRVEYK